MSSASCLLQGFQASDTKETSGRRKGIMDLLADFVPPGRQVIGYNIVLSPGNPTCNVDA